MSKVQMTLAGLVAGGWRDRTFVPFGEGVEISSIVEGRPAVALLRYQPGARVRRHFHPGLETILVLEGSQCDEYGHYVAGTFILNPAGTSHTVWSDDGCVVLIQWELPVEFIGSGP